jgi:uncharacterized protein (TIGR02246 family)
MRKSSQFLLWLTLAVATALPTAPTALARDDDPLQSVRVQWEKAMLAGDATAAAALFATDATQLRPGRPTNRGRPAIAASYADDFRAATVTAVKMTPAKTTVNHDMAVEHGTFTITWLERADNAPPMGLHGRYLLQARRADGRWQLELEMHTIETTVGIEQLR